MAADATYAVQMLDVSGFDFASVEFTYIPVVGLNISTIDVSFDGGSGGGGGSVRPTSGFIYPRGDG